MNTTENNQSSSPDGTPPLASPTQGSPAAGNTGENLSNALNALAECTAQRDRAREELDSVVQRLGAKCLEVYALSQRLGWAQQKLALRDAINLKQAQKIHDLETTMKGGPN